MRGERSGGGGGPACFFNFFNLNFSGEFSPNGEFDFQQGENFVVFWGVF
jgi:hypothetical protein